MSPFLAESVLASAAVVLGFATAVLGLVNQRRISRTGREVSQISVSVDGRLSELLGRVGQLTETLHDADIRVPDPPPPPPAP
jgi:hypothetical protein